LPLSRRPSNEQDVATDTASARARAPRARYGAMKLPHERDEEPQRSGAPDAITQQGARDVEQGRVDTDCYTAVGERHDRKPGGG
jgi:hypothetical protein